jgi:hypothetical protein
MPRIHRVGSPIAKPVTSSRCFSSLNPHDVILKEIERVQGHKDASKQEGLEKRNPELPSCGSSKRKLIIRVKLAI